MGSNPILSATFGQATVVAWPFFIPGFSSPSVSEGPMRRISCAVPDEWADPTKPIFRPLSASPQGERQLIRLILPPASSKSTSKMRQPPRKRQSDGIRAGSAALKTGQNCSCYSRSCWFYLSNGVYCDWMDPFRLKMVSISACRAKTAIPLVHLSAKRAHRCPGAKENGCQHTGYFLEGDSTNALLHHEKTWYCQYANSE